MPRKFKINKEYQSESDILQKEKSPDFLEEAEIKAKNLFPDAKDMVADEDSSYIFFGPFEYFRRGLIDEGMIKNLQEGASLLSVGVGPARLERFIQQGYALKVNQITIADVDWHKEALESDFLKIKFDMTKKWPEFDTHFDYIIFPESFGVAHGKFDNESFTSRFWDILNPVVEKILSNHDSDIASMDRKLFKNIIEADLPRAVQELNTITEALKYLNPSGEIRMRGHLISDQCLAYIILMLKELYPTIHVKASYNNLFIKK